MLRHGERDPAYVCSCRRKTQTKDEISVPIFGCSIRDGKRPREGGDAHGGVAQLGEHLPCKQGVMGSNPIISTKPGKTGRQDGKEGREQTGNGLIAQQVRARA